jgi:predicted HAD superfamily hydrolase
MKLKKSMIVILAITSLFLTSCATMKEIIIPLSDKAEIEDTYTIIWNGTSQAYRYVNEKWERDEKYDYIFDVIQKRYPNNWKSTKNMHRIVTKNIVIYRNYATLSL